MTFIDSSNMISSNKTSSNIDSSDMIKKSASNDEQLHLTDKPVNSSTDNYRVSKDDNYLYAASATDMTGLAPTVAHNEYEAQSYEEVFPYLPPVYANTQHTHPEESAAHGIHTEYRTKVTKQSQHDVSKKHVK